jgi:WD40 repeat protein
VTIHRGVLLFGDSGAGKSSIVNAGLLPAMVADGVACERLRLQRAANNEISLEWIGPAEGSVLGSALATGGGDARRATFSIEGFAQRVRAAAAAGLDLLLIFDHFEDVVVLFDDAPQGVRRRLVAMLIELLRDEMLTVKLLLVFREDYLGWMSELLATCPERHLGDLRLHTPDTSELGQIIRGPFERFPGHYRREIEPALARRLTEMLATKFELGDVSLAEVQTVCLRLWQSVDPELLLQTRGPQGILEDYLNEELDALSPEMREAAVALLSEMITPAGTRNVISGTDLTRRVSKSTELPLSLVEKTLERLDQKSRLVHCERRREVRLYEIASEFLVPWIEEQRRQSELSLVRRRDRRRRRFLWRLVAGAAAISLLLAIVAAWALSQRSTARRAATVSHREAVAARSLALVSAAQEHLEDRLDVSLILARKAYQLRPSAQARNVLISALQQARAAGEIGILHGLATGISSLAISPNGRTLAAAANYGTVVLWDLRTHRRVAEITAGTSRIKSIAFSLDGRLFVTGDEDGAIRLWSAQTYRQLGRPIEMHSRTLGSVALSPDGRTLATGQLNGPLSLWSVATHEQLGAPLTVANVSSIAFSPDGRVLAAGSYKRTVQLWSLSTRRPLGAPLTTLTEEVTEVAFDSSGHTLGTLTTDLFAGGRVQLWDVASHRQRGPTIGGSRELSWFAFNPGGQTLTAGGNGGTAIWSLATGHAVGQSLSDTAERIETIALSRDGKTVASADRSQVELTPTDPPQPLETIDPPSGYHPETKLVGFGADGRTLVAASENGRVLRWSLARRNQPVSMLGTRLASARCSVISPEGDAIATLAPSGDLRYWSLLAGRVSQALVGSSRAVPNEPEVEADYDCGQRISFEKRGQALAIIAGQAANEVQLLNTAARSVVGRLTAEGETFDRVAFSTDGRLLVTVSSPAYSDGTPGRIRIWDARDAHRVGTPFVIDADIGRIALTPDGKSLVFISRSQSAELGEVVVWSVPAHRALGRLPLAQSESISNIALSPDGRTLATTSGEGGGDEEVQGQVRLWDLASLRSLGTPLSENAEPITSLAFSPTGNAVAFVGEDGSIKLWRGVLWSTPAELRDKVCGLVGEGLARVEWAKYVPGIPYRAGC